MQWGNAACESCVNRDRQEICQACRMAPGPAGYGWQWTMYRPKNGQCTITTQTNQATQATQTTQATKATQQSDREPPHQHQSQPQSQSRLGGMSPSSALTVLREFRDWRKKWEAYDWLTAPAKDFPFTSDTVDEALDTAVEFLQERVP